MPPKSTDTLNEILFPSILPFLIGIWPPSGPPIDPVSIAPSALKLNSMGMAPIGVSIEPDHLPSTSAARRGANATTHSVTTNARCRAIALFISSLPAFPALFPPSLRLLHDEIEGH